MTDLPILDRDKRKLPIDIVECLRVGRQEHGKSLASQIVEIARLTFGPGKLSPEEYFCYRLYDDSRYGPGDKRRFAGEASQGRISEICCHLFWMVAAHDKLLASAALRSLGFPVPRTVAVYHPSRAYGAVPVLRTRRELADFLANGMPYPFFSKPIAGMYSLGVAGVAAHDGAAGELVLTDGQRITVERYLDDIEAASDSGYLFQELLHPHDAVRAICGDRLATVRVVVLIEDGVPEIFRTVWKIPTGANMADNFWRPGNLLAAIDGDSGRIRRVVQGVGPAQVELDAHPNSGAPIRGVVLPDWDRVKELSLAAAATLPRLRLQGWDLALCAGGPVLLEVNVGGDFILPQIATGTGVLDDRFRRFLDSCKKTPALRRRWGRLRFAPP